MEFGIDEILDELPEKKEPRVSSNDPVERKLARRLRIQKRLEAKKKRRRDGERTEDDEEEAPKEPLEQQIINSGFNLENLIQDGQEQISNVRVASDAREVKRRTDQAEARLARQKMVEDEARECLEKLEIINEKWEKISNYKDPLDIYGDMEKQKEKCEELLNRKNEVIEKLNKELDRNDEQFRRDQKKQKEDLNLLAERIDGHIEMMKKAYRHELAMLENVISEEQHQLIDTSNREWEELYKERDKDEVVNMKKKFELILDYEKEMDTIYVEHQEKFREAKIRLETDIRILQQELEKIKALCLLNSEKLDYNFLILKKRDAENIIMKAHQKRRINRLQDVVNKLRAKLEEAEKTTLAEKQRLTDEVLKLHQNIIDIGHKADMFAEVNDKRYNQVWEMNDKIAKDLLRKILTADRIIYEQQLGIPWLPPELAMMTKEDLPSYQSAMALVEKLFREKAENTSSMEPIPYGPEELAVIKSKGNLLRHILYKIADSGGFLVEEKIFPLLFPYKKACKTLVKIENIFKALGVESEDDVQMLKEYFLPYVSCEVCGYSPSREHSMQTLFKTQEAVEDQEDDKKSIESRTTSSEGNLEVDLFSALRRPWQKQTQGDGEGEGGGGGGGASETSDEGGGGSVVSHAPSAAGGDAGEGGGGREAAGSAVAAAAAAAATGTTAGAVTRASVGAGAAALPQTARPAANIDLQAIKSLGTGGDRPVCDRSHPLKIDPIYVLKALRAFVSDFSKRRQVSVETMSQRLAKEHRTVSRSLRLEDVRAYWERFTQIFTPEREKLWDALAIGLNKYLDILQARHKLNGEVHSLRQQNEELKRLLQQYLTSFGQSGKHTLPPIKSAKQKREMCR